MITTTNVMLRRIRMESWIAHVASENLSSEPAEKVIGHSVPLKQRAKSVTRLLSAC